MDASRSNWYVRHDGSSSLSVESETNAGNLELFRVQSSFILHQDMFYSARWTLESLNLSQWYVKSQGNGRLGIAQLDNTMAYHDAASYIIYDYDSSS